MISVHGLRYIAASDAPQVKPKSQRDSTPGGSRRRHGNFEPQNVSKHVLGQNRVLGQCSFYKIAPPMFSNHALGQIVAAIATIVVATASA